LRIQFDQNIYAKTKELIEKVLNKQKNHKKIKNWLLASWEEDKDLLFCIDFCWLDVLHPAIIERAWPPNVD
jgi:hypothetical protein